MGGVHGDAHAPAMNQRHGRGALLTQPEIVDAIVALENCRVEAEQDLVGILRLAFEPEKLALTQVEEASRAGRIGAFRNHCGLQRLG